jgi:adenosine kinase
MKIVITGSIAYDYLMSFPGSFSDQIIPEQLTRLSLSFLVDDMQKRRGGVAPNIAYTLALLGERPMIYGTAGQDFGEYKQWLEKHGVDTSKIVMTADKFTASFFCSTDVNNCQIASFYTGAMADDAQLSIGALDFKPDIVIVSPTDPRAMINFATECRDGGIRFIFDPGQQCARASGDELRAGILGADALVCNDYEMELIRTKTGLSEDDVLKHSSAVIVTKGAKGCTLHLKGGPVVDVPAVQEKNMADPTGVGDAFRGGLLKGLAMGLDWVQSARIGSVAATYALEHVGGQSHAFTMDDFATRHVSAFGPMPAHA